MSRCTFCELEMLEADSCLKGQWERVPYVNPFYVHPEHRCHDCNVKLGAFHHPGCDMERCPSCGRQLIGCGCEVAAEITHLRADSPPKEPTA